MTKKNSPKQLTSMRHGLYARYFDELEISELATIGEGIDEELKALRIAAARLFERASDKSRDWESEMRLLEGFGRQCLEVASLVRTKSVIANMSGEVRDMIKNDLVTVMTFAPSFSNCWTIVSGQEGGRKTVILRFFSNTEISPPV